MTLRTPNLKSILSAIAALCIDRRSGAGRQEHSLRAARRAARPSSDQRLDHSIGAEGLVEPSREDISIAPFVPGLVTVVRVKAQQQVHAGDVLWEQDGRELSAQLPVREADIASARAAVAVTEAALADAQVQLTLIESVPIAAQSATKICNDGASQLTPPKHNSPPIALHRHAPRRRSSRLAPTCRDSSSRRRSTAKS